MTSSFERSLGATHAGSYSSVLVLARGVCSSGWMGRCDEVLVARKNTARNIISVTLSYFHKTLMIGVGPPVSLKFLTRYSIKRSK